MTKVQDTVPIYNNLTTQNNEVGNEWSPWFTSLHRNVQHLNYLPNPHLVLNPDFNWSRTKGTTPTTSNGEFVEQWDVDAGGATFSITPTNYTSTTNSSGTGSELYPAIRISVTTANDFEIYQTSSNNIQKYQDKQLAFSIRIFNNNSDPVKAKFKVDFDTDNDTVIDVTSESKAVYIQPGIQDIVMRVDTPVIATDNQTNTVYLKLVFFDLSGTPSLDLYFIKPEFATDSTPLVVDHIQEKVLIDNA